MTQVQSSQRDSDRAASPDRRATLQPARPDFL